MKKKKKLLNLTLIAGLTLYPLSVSALQKSETVYSNLNSDGSIYKTVVSNHLSWITENEIEDESELKNILNINGEEEFNQNQNKLSWKSLGKDIFYQGETDKPQPIKTEIKYFLNEEEKNIEEMLGKEGNIKIEFTFTNNLKNMIRINGINNELCTPFVTTIGTIIDSENNKNFKINNGKIINTGTRNMVVGLASPGLYESLNIKELKELNKITLTYETTNFSMNSIYIVSTPKLLEETDLKIFDSMDNLYNNMQELQKNMDKLENGIIELEKGTSTLSNGSKELVNGIKEAKNAINRLNNGSLALEKGLKQIVLALENASSELNKINSANSLNQLNTLKKENTNTINLLIEKTGTNLENLTKLYIQNNLKDYEGNEPYLLNIKSTYELICLLNMNNKSINTTIESLKNTTSNINTLITSLKNATNELSKGATNLSYGLTNLKKGIDKIYNGSTSLDAGIQDLNKGANTLCNGAKDYNKLGIQKLNNHVKMIKNYTNKFESLLDLSKDYNGFTSKNSNTTNFISIIKPIKITYKR